MIDLNFKFGRVGSMSRTLSILNQRDSGVKIVEVGVARGEGQENSNGHSSSLFAWYVQRYQTFSHYIGIDISKDAIDYATKRLSDLHLFNRQRTSLVCMDAIAYFKNEFESNCEKKGCNSAVIDLLYLDGWDYDENDEAQNKLSEQATLECLKAAEPFFDDKSMVLFDDVFGDNWHGKAKLAIPYLLEKGWVPAFGRMDTQVLMIQNCVK